GSRLPPRRASWCKRPPRSDRCTGSPPVAHPQPPVDGPSRAPLPRTPNRHPGQRHSRTPNIPQSQHPGSQTQHPRKDVSMPGLLAAIAGGVLLVLLLVIYILSRIKVAGPNEAFIVTGRKGRSVEGLDGTVSTDLSGKKVVMVASVFVLTDVQKLHVLGLPSRQISVEIKGAVSKQGYGADLQGVAIGKVGGTEHAIRAAAQRFLHQQEEVEDLAREVLA